MQLILLGLLSALLTGPGQETKPGQEAKPAPEKKSDQPAKTDAAGGPVGKGVAGTSSAPRTRGPVFKDPEHNKAHAEMQKAWEAYCKAALNMTGQLKYTVTTDNKVTSLAKISLMGDGENWKSAIAVGKSEEDIRDFMEATLVRTRGGYRQALYLTKRPKSHLENNKSLSAWSAEEDKVKLNETNPDKKKELREDSHAFVCSNFEACIPIRLSRDFTSPIDSLLQSEAIDPVSFKTTQEGEETIARIEFKIDNAKRGGRRGNYIKEGWIELLPKKSWVLHRAEYVYQERDKARRWRYENTYEMQKGVPVLKGAKGYTVDEKENPKEPKIVDTVVADLKINEAPPKAEEFSLVSFGMEEIEPGAGGGKDLTQAEIDELFNKIQRDNSLFIGLPLWAWGAIGAAVLLLIIFLATRKKSGEPAAA